MYPVCLSSDMIPIREASKINRFKKYAPHLFFFSRISPFKNLTKSLCANCNPGKCDEKYVSDAGEQNIFILIFRIRQ